MISVGTSDVYNVMKVSIKVTIMMTSPNDARHIVWALCDFFNIHWVLSILNLIFKCFMGREIFI